MTARFSAAELASATGGEWQGAVEKLPPPDECHGICTDSRELFEGCIFLALVGERFDGHQYVECCAKAGAVMAIVDRRWWEGLPRTRQDVLDLPVLVVDNTLWAYMAMGAYHRQRCEARIIGITGSSGKTTVKENLYHLLKQLASTQATEKNYNNDIGLTQTLLHLLPDTRYQICEMAMRGPGEIARLSLTARPDIGILLNIGPAHLGRLGSLAAIAQAKCEIVQGMDPVLGKLIVNGDDPLLREHLPQVWQGQTVWVSEATDASEICLNEGGCYSFVWHGQRVVSPQPGRHGVMNTLLILTTALELGFSPAHMVSALSNVPADPEGRWEAREIVNLPGSAVINDAYNANPASMCASLGALSESLGSGHRRAVLVLGGMNELGDFSQRYHEDVGRVLVQRFPGSTSLAGLVLVGTQEARWILDGIEKTRAGAGGNGVASYPVIHCSSAAEVLPSLTLNGLFPLENTVYFLKGSRSYQLERVISALNEALATRPAQSVENGVPC